ncbi:hypothetical protein F4808DRAFT_419687 [Astrocystis sublimbata]|nr:hypothetical protein F4808DRAFT_419687 [Astrocystis sublimbata]
MEQPLKPGMLDSAIDVEPSKSSVTTESQAYCATVVANLEGFKDWALPSYERCRATLAQLDARIRALENASCISPPPPMDVPSWDSLVWRVTRLHLQPHLQPAWITDKAYTSRVNAAPLEPSIELLRSTVAAIGGTGRQSWAVFIGEKDQVLDDDAFLQAAAQFLSNLAGKQRYKITGSFELRDNCSIALNLSLQADVNPAFFYRGARPTVGSISCNCHCQGPARMSMPRPARKIVNVRPKKHRRTGVKARIARVFGKLAFWRRRHGNDSDSDASSMTSKSTSSTL